MAPERDRTEECEEGLRLRKKRKLPRNNKPDALAVLVEGQKLATEDNLDEALRLLRRGLSIAEGSKDKRAQSLIHSEMGLCYQERGQTSHALKEFEKAYQASPRSSSCLLMLASSYLDTGDLEKAGRYLTKALALAEMEYQQGRYAKDASNLLNACLLLSKASRDLAAKTLQFGLRKFPDHPLLKRELQALAGS